MKKIIIMLMLAFSLSLVTAQVLFDGFEVGNTQGSTTINGWTQATGPTYTSQSWTANSTNTSYNRTPRTGSFNVTLRYSGEAWLFRPVDLTAGTSYDIELYARQDGSTSTNANIGIYYGATASIAGMTNTILAQTGMVAGNYQKFSGSFVPSVTQTYYLGIKGYINGTPWYISMDDVKLQVTPNDPEPTNHATSFAAGTAAYTTIQLNWTGAIGAQVPQGYLILAKTGTGVYASVADGTPVANDAVWTDFNGAVNVPHLDGANTYTFTGLTHTTQYDFVIYPYTNGGANINFKTDGVIPTVTASTQSTTLPIPYVQDFNASTSLPANWTGNMGVNSTHGNGGGNALTSNLWSSNTSCNIVTNPIGPQTSTSQLEFDYRIVNYTGYPATATVLGGSDNIQVQVSVGGGAFTTIHTINSANHITSNAYATVILPLAAYDTQVVTVKFLGTWGAGDYYFDLDNVILREPPAGAPGEVTLNLPADEATGVSVLPTFSWFAPTTGGIATGYDLYLDTTDGSTLFAEDVSSPYTLVNALPYSTEHFWTVVAYNNEGDGPATAAFSFTTMADPTIAAPVTEEFSTGIIPTGWTLSGPQNWVFSGSADYGGSTNGGKPASTFAWVDGSGTAGLTGITLTTPPIDLSALTEPLMKFGYYSNNTDTPAVPADQQTLMVDVYSGGTWTNVFTNNSNNPAWQTASIPLTGYSGSIMVRFVVDKGTGSPFYDDILVDDFFIMETPTSPIFSYNPDAIDFGMVMQNIAAPAQNVVITNTGGGTLNIAATDLAMSGTNPSMFSIDTTDLPAALAGGESVSIPVSVYPTAEGPLSATLTITNSQTRTEYPVALSATGLAEGIVVIGNGSTDNNLPINPYFGYTYSQSIFLQSEINVPDQRIEKVWYYWNGVAEDVNSNNWTIYMGHTAATEFTSTTDWVPLANLSQVFSGEVALPAVAGWIEIPLNVPFIYNNTDNLVIAVDENEASYDGSSEFFYNTTATTNRSLLFYADNTNPDPAAPVAGTLVMAYPNVKLQLGDIPVGAPEAVTLTYPADRATGLPVDGFNLSWTPSSTGGTPTSYRVYLATDESTIYEENSWTTNNTSFNPVTEGGVTFNYLDYYLWTVRAINDTGNAVVEPPFAFEIEEDPATPIDVFPYTVDFEAHANNTLPSRWTRSSNATGWEVGSDLSSTYWSIPDHTVYAAANDDAAGSGADGSMDLLVSPFFNLDGDYEGVPLITFDSYFTGSYGQLAYLEVSTNGTDWTNIYNVAGGTEWETLTVSLADYDGMTGVQLRFHADDAGDWATGWAVDNISLDFVNIDLMVPIVSHYPVIGWPDLANDIPIYAEVTDDQTWNSGIASVTLSYTVDGGVAVDLPMSLVEGFYQAAIPGQVAGSLIAYNITAVDASAQANTITTDTWDFYVDSPVWLQYDNNVVSTSVGLSSGTFGVMTGFENPFGDGNPIQINSITGQFSSAISANVHVYVYDGTDFIDLIPSFSQAFEAGVLTTIPLTGCTTTAGVFYVAYTDVVGPAYHAIDQTQAYYPGTHFVHFGAGMTTANLSTIEGAGFPGSWLIRANVEAGVSELDAPVVTITNEVDGPTLSWDPITGANSYNIYGSDDPYADPFNLITSVASSPYLYTGSEDYMFFQVIASSDGLPIRNANISSRVNQLRSMVSNRKAMQAPKAAQK